MKYRSINWVAAAVVAGIAFLTGCAGTAHIEKDPAVDLSRYQTYAWMEKPNVEGEKSTRNNELIEASIRNSVNNELMKKGWKEVSAKPDIMLNVELLVEKNQVEQKDAVYSPSYTRSYYNRFSGRVVTLYYPGQFVGYDSYATTVKEATVTITLVDNKTDKTVWQGWTTSELNGGRITGNEIDRNVKTIFRKFDTGK
jgi:hypothetical protein